MSDIQIIINGGNNQILPNASTAIQYFFGDRLSEQKQEDNAEGMELPPEALALTIYINKVNVPHYVALIGECKTATDLARVVVDMVTNEPRLTPDEMVQGRFIQLLLPFAVKINKGATVDNVRQRINDEWARRRNRR